MNWADSYKREEGKASKKVTGLLRCVITGAEEQKSKTSGKDMIVVSVKPSGAEFSVKYYIVKNDKFCRNMTIFFDSFPEIQDGDFEFLHWVGCEGAAKFFIEEVGDKKYTKIRWFIEASRAKDLPPFEGKKPDKIEVNNDFSDINEDDLPF